MHELLARDIQRERAALVEHLLGGHDIKHRPGQRFVEPAGPQLRRICFRPGLSRRQLLGRSAGARPHLAVVVDAEERLHERRAIEAEEHLLGHLVARLAIGIQGGDDLVGDLCLQREERIVGRHRLAGSRHAGGQCCTPFIQGLLSANIV